VLIGTDITVISRIERLFEKFGDKAYKRYLNESEIELIKSSSTAAGFWAAKEAFSKALGCGIGAELSFLDIFIAKTSKNQPYIVLTPHLKKKFNIKSISLSIAHDGGFAIAVVAVVLDNK
jgi:holo-[acyl-carrier protein] synthase